MQKIKSLFQKYREIIMYLVFGVMTTIVSWGSYVIFIRFIGLNITPGKAISWICAVTFAYITNKLWVFDSKSWNPKTVAREVISFFAARGVTGTMEIFGVPALVKLGLDQKIFGTKGMLANIIMSVLVVVLNYVFSKIIVFRKKKAAKK